MLFKRKEPYHMYCHIYRNKNPKYFLFSVVAHESSNKKCGVIVYNNEITNLLLL